MRELAQPLRVEVTWDSTMAPVTAPSGARAAVMLTGARRYGDWPATSAIVWRIDRKGTASAP